MKTLFALLVSGALLGGCAANVRSVQLEALDRRYDMVYDQLQLQLLIERIMKEPYDEKQ